MKIVKPDQRGIDLAVKYLKAGQAVIFPTDTAYALGVDATDIKAVKRLYMIKERRPQKPVHIVVSGPSMARKYVECGEREELLYKKFLPGPLTIICHLRTHLKKQSSWRILSAGTGTIGIRVPRNKFALELVKKLGHPITATSANIAHAPTAYSIIQIRRQYGKKTLKPDIVLDSGKLRKVQPSTMVKIHGNKIQIIRRGPISKKQIKNALFFHKNK